MGNFPRFSDHLECDASHGEERYETNASNLMSMKIDGCQGRKKFHAGHLNNIAMSSMWHVLALPFTLHFILVFVETDISFVMFLPAYVSTINSLKCSHS
jgi:hypothetical protein